VGPRSPAGSFAIGVQLQRFSATRMFFRLPGARIVTAFAHGCPLNPFFPRIAEMRTSRALALALPMLLAACTPAAPPPPPPPDVAAIKSAIETANKAQIDAILKGDATGAVANYTDDAVVLFPNAPAWQGKAATQKAMGDMMGQMTFKDPTFHTVDVVVSGDMAVETGTYAWTMVPKKGKPIKDEGKYLTVWKKQADGSWKIIRDMNNTNLPAGQ
jgi:uncharacterized protein (TIGR02246 family)